jgi:UDP-glucose 4-epimerase
MDLVTGGLGFIGNELVRQLRRQGPVAILDNRSRIAPRIDDLADVPVFDVDVTDAKAVSAVVERLHPRHVFHLAAIHYIPECNANPERTIRVNVEGTLAVLNACAASRVERVVLASSGAIYADCATPIAETSPVAPVDVYGWSKAFAEDLCRWFVASKPLTVVSARLFNNFGPRETNPHIIPEIIGQLHAGTTLRLGNVSSVRDYVYTSDTARALIALANMDVRGLQCVNVATGSGASVQDLVAILTATLGRRLEIELDQSRLRDVDKQTQVADVSLIRQRTSWKPTVSLESGLRDLLEFEGLVVNEPECAPDA